MNRLVSLIQNRPIFVLIIIAILGSFIFLNLIFFNLFKQPEQPPEENTGPKVIYPNPPSQETLNQEQSYSTIKIGETTENEIKQIPNLKNTEVKGNQTEFSFPSARYNDNIVVTENDVVVFKKIITIDGQTWQHPPLSSYLNAYGPPEAEFIGSNTYGAFFKTYVYPSKGLAFIGNPTPDELYEIQVFEPTSLEQYLNKWGQDINENLGKEEHPEGELLGE